MIKFPPMWSAAAISASGLVMSALLAGCGGPSASGPVDNRPAANAQAEIARRMGSQTGPPSSGAGAVPAGAPSAAPTAPPVTGMPGGVPTGPPR